jgi:hypothetical protein
VPWLNLATVEGYFATTALAYSATQMNSLQISQTLHMMLGHTYAMRKVIPAKGLLLLSLVISPIAVAPSASADSNPQATPSADAFKGLMDQYRADREAFMNQMKQRSMQIRAINITFKNACDTAAADFKSAMASAKTPDAKNAANAARKNAISSAIAVRDAAIAALGAEPLPPVEPMKPMKAPKGKSR